jgi:type I restriction enzyme S subunit
MSQTVKLSSTFLSRQWKPYPSYKPSGVEWLGEVPEHWQLSRLKFLAEINPSKSEVSYLPDNLEVSFLPMELVGNGNLLLEKNKTLGEIKQGFTYFRDGDVLVAKITPSFENGKGAIAANLEHGIGFGTTEIHVIRPTKLVDREFIFYLTQSHPFRGFGATQMYGTAGQKRVPDWFRRLIRILCKRSKIPVIQETASWHGRRKKATEWMKCSMSC